MRYFLRLQQWLSLISAIAISSSAQADEVQVISAVKPSVAFVEASVAEPSGKITTESGTGFVCSRSGYMLTANHVVQTRGAQVFVTLGSNTGEKLSAYVVQAPNFVDAALLQLPDSHRPYVPVGFGDPDRLEQGDHILSVGFPLGSDYSSASGSLSNKAGKEGLWQVSIPLNYGNSGGPVLDKLGEVVGMIRGGVSGAQQVNYMIPLNLLSPLITGCGLKWPPYDNPSNPAVTTRVKPPLTVPAAGSNCHEVTDISPGIPPVYSKRTVCE